MTYAADVWYTPTHKREGAGKTNGSVGIMRRMASMQWMASAITGALRTTPTDLLDLHAGLWPLHLMFQQVCHQATQRIASLPKSHPLHAVYWTRVKRYIKMHRSPLHELAALYGIMLGSLETLSPVRVSPAYEIKAKVTSVGSEEEETVGPLGDGKVQIFSDGLGLDGRVGAAAVMYRRGQAPKVLHYNMGSLTEHTVFEAEAVGVILVLHMLKTEKHVRKVSI